MDGTDRRIWERWTTVIGDTKFVVEEQSWLKRDRVSVGIASSASASGMNVAMSVMDLDAAIRVLTLARERLEALGAMDGLEKVAP